MNLRGHLVTASVVMLFSSTTLAITIGKPVANKSFDKNNLTIEVSGSCRAGKHVKVDATDSASKSTSQVWVMCEAWGYSAPLIIASLADGNIRVRALQVHRGKNEVANVIISKTASAVVPTPTPIPLPTVIPVVMPAPTPKPTATPTPAPATGKMLWGVNGHDIRAVYPLSQSAAVFKMLSEKNLRTYRVDVTHTNTIILDTLIPLSKQYNIKLRPMFYPMTKDQAYAIGKKYGRDLEIVEIGNEQNLEGKTGAQNRINAMIETYKGLKQAEAELGIKIKISINVTNCNTDDLGGRCGGDKNGDMWFVDMAKASGFNFDVITYHYYPWYGNKGYWFDMYLGQMRAMATKYKVPIYFNETSCAEVYRGNKDGGFPGDKGCYDSMNDLFIELTTKYSDIVQEINMYELFNEPYQANLEPVYESEANFGLMYDINRPKQLLQLLVNWANK
ncbi:glycosyl hydrolase 53 family protein [Bdellovibrio sp. HCB337]|uniref:glycosyl hydrolase 53 family protein n=1 Tax=Bdellovibrio sp. HCB337 TaxID=3394358 RepID=UPI0039A57226